MFGSNDPAIESIAKKIILSHPSKSECIRWRVWDKELGIQEYFSFKKLGGEDKAYKKAYAFAYKVAKKKYYLQKARELSINKLFDGSNSEKIKGMSRKVRERFGRKPIEEFCLYAGKKQTTIKVNKDTFEAAFEKATNWLMKQHKITPDYEIRVELAKRKKYYWVDKL